MRRKFRPLACVLYLLAGFTTSIAVAYVSAMRVSDNTLLDLKPADGTVTPLPAFLSNWPSPTRVERSSSLFATVSEAYSTRGPESVWTMPYNQGEMRCIYHLEQFGFPMRCIEHRSFLMQSGDRDGMKAELSRVRNALGRRAEIVMPEWMHSNIRAGMRFVPAFVLPLGLVVNTCFWAAASVLGFAGIRSVVQRLRRRRGQCASCGYSLVASTLDRCPECGTVPMQVAGPTKKTSP
jgi:hypothetical protein